MQNVWLIVVGVCTNPSEDERGPENVGNMQIYFHLQALSGGSVNIYAAEVPFCFELGPRGLTFP